MLLHVKLLTNVIGTEIEEIILEYSGGLINNQ